MGQHFQLFLLVAAIVGFSLLTRGSCDREANQAFQDNENITPSPLVGSNNGWRPVISPMTVSPSRSPSYRYIGNTASSSSGNNDNKESVKNINVQTINEDGYRDNREYVSKQYSYNINVDNIVKGKTKNTNSPNTKTNYENWENLNANNENRQNVQRFEIDDIVPSRGISDNRQSNEDNTRQYSNYKNIREHKHPVLSKLQLHMDSAEKAKKREHTAAQSAMVETFVSTPSSLLGSFSEFGHATVRSREPASSKRDVIRPKNKEVYQVTPSNNEYSMHLVPPPRFPPGLARYPDMIKKPYLTYRFPKPDLLVDEQRHVYYVHPPPGRPGYFPPAHTPRPPGPFFGPPTIPNFAGLNSPHHYPGALTGGLFPGNEEIKYYQRPDVQKPVVKHFGAYQQPTRGEHIGSQITPTSQPLLSVTSRHPPNSLSEDKNVDQRYERPDSPPFKNVIHQEEIVTGRPLNEVRGSEGATFTVGSSFLAGNKQENDIRPHHITSQQFHGQAGLSPFSTISPITFEQAFNTGRPNPSILSNTQGDEGRITRPFFTEESAVSFQHLQNTAPISHKLPVIQPHYHKEVVEGNIEGTTPHFIPTIHDTQSFINDHSRRKPPTAPTHLNEVHHSSQQWSEPFPPPEVSPIIDIDVRTSVHTTPSPPPPRKPSRRPSLHAHRRPHPVEETAIEHSEPTRDYRPNDYREPESSTRRPSLQEQDTLEYSTPTRGRPTESRQPEATTGYPFVQEQEAFEQVTPTRVYRPKVSRRPVSSTEVPLSQGEIPTERSPSSRDYSRQPETSTEHPVVQEVETIDQDASSIGSRLKDVFESSTGGSILEEAGITEEITIQQTTERPAQSEQKIRRPYASRKPSRYRPQSVDKEKETWPQSTERPHRRPSHSRFTTASPERKTLDEVVSQHKDVRPQHRRRRPQHTTVETVTLPAQEEVDEDVHSNQVAYPSLNELFDKIPLSSQSDVTRVTSTPQPARRRNPYITTRGKDRHHPQDDEDDVKISASPNEITTLADAAEPLTSQPEPEEILPSQKEREYSVHEDTDEYAYDGVSHVDPERPNEDVLTTTSTTTQSPVTTTRSTSSRYKPRLRYGTNSTRPRFSVKDYKDRINRLPQTKGDDVSKTTESESTPRTRYQSKVRGSFQNSDDSNKNDQDSISETETSPRIKFPSRVRGGPYYKPDINRNEQNEEAAESTTETIRNKFRPKFGSGSSRFRTTSTTVSPPVDDGEGSTEKTGVKLSTSRIRMPTGKYFSRYRSTTEDNKDPIEEAASSLDITSTTKPVMRTKNIFSASKRRYPTRIKYGSQVDASSTEQTEYDESITSRIEEILQKLNNSRTTPSSELNSTFATTKTYDQDYSTSSLQNTFPGMFQETSKHVDNEIKTPATRTFIFRPTLPTTRDEDTEKSVTTEASTSAKLDIESTEPDKKTVTEESEKNPVTEEVKPLEEEISPSQRVADLTSAATSGGYFNVMSLVKRKPFQYSVPTDEHILPLEAFFSNKEYSKDSNRK